MKTILKPGWRFFAALLAVLLVFGIFSGSRMLIQARPETERRESTLQFEVTLEAVPAEEPAESDSGEGSEQQYQRKMTATEPDETEVSLWGVTYVFKKKYTAAVSDPNVDNGAEQDVSSNLRIDPEDPAKGIITYAGTEFPVAVPTIGEAVGYRIDGGSATIGGSRNRIHLCVDGAASYQINDLDQPAAIIYGNKEDRLEISGLETAYGNLIFRPKEDSSAVRVEDNLIISDKVLAGQPEHITVRAEVRLAESDTVYAYKEIPVTVLVPVVKKLELADSKQVLNENRYVSVSDPELDYVFKGTGLSAKMLSITDGEGKIDDRTTLSEEGILTVKFQDLADGEINIGIPELEKTADRSFLVDTERPAATLTLEGDAVNSSVVFRRAGSDEIFIAFHPPVSGSSGMQAEEAGREETVTAVLTVTDNDLSGKFGEDQTLSVRTADRSWTLLKNTDKEVVFTKTLSVKTEEAKSLSVSFVIEDKAGLTAEEVRFSGGALQYDPETGILEQTLTADRRRPGADASDPPELFLTAETGSAAVINGNIPLYDRPARFSVKVSDPDSGLREVSWIIGTVDHPETACRAVSAPTGKLNITAGDADAEGMIEAAIENGERNDLVLTVTATDLVGNSITRTERLAVDTLAPRIVLSDPVRAVRWEYPEYYNQPRIITVSVEDLNLDPAQTPVNVFNGDVSGWSSSGIRHTIQCRYGKDEDQCFFGMKAKDFAGNENSGSVENPEFVIDMTAPIIHVAFDNNNARGGKYYNAERTARITIDEHNFRPADVSVPVSAKLSGKEIAAPGISMFTGSESHEAQLSFVQDGDYSFSVSYMDKAGNAAEEAVVEEFTIDRTAPEAVIENVKDLQAYTGKIRPTVTLTDTNFDPDGYDIRWKVATLSGSREAVPTAGHGILIHTGRGISFTFHDLENAAESDGIYTLSATVTDRAGNTTHTEPVTYSVNRFGSVYSAGNAETKDLADRRYIGRAPALSIRETNPNPLSSFSVSVAANGSSRTLKEGIDYQIRKSESEGKWKQYTYEIEENAFCDSSKAAVQGTYVVTVYSEDEAGNHNSSRTNTETNRMDLEFTIDNEPATGYITVAGLEEKSRRIRAAETDCTIHWEDNSEVSEAGIFLNGTKVKTLSGAEIAEADGQYTLTVRENNREQSLYAELTDAAGNRSTLEPVTFFLNSSWVQQSFHNTGIWIGILAGIAVTAAVIVLLIKGKKKRSARRPR